MPALPHFHWPGPARDCAPSQWREALTHIPRVACVRAPGTALRAPAHCLFSALSALGISRPVGRVARRQARALSWRAGGSLDLSQECSGRPTLQQQRPRGGCCAAAAAPPWKPAADSCLRRGTLLSGKLTPGFPWPWLLGGDKTRGVATECYRPVAPDHKRPLHAPDSSVLTLHTSHHPIVNSQIKTFSEQID